MTRTIKVADETLVEIRLECIRLALNLSPGNDRCAQDVARSAETLARFVVDGASTGAAA